jgi:ABC-type multidrug transport system fused ATPase/permease subunit
MIRSWRQRVGYVPQSVFLANASVAENIAFGLKVAEIDHDAVKNAATRAQVDAFVRSLPHGYETTVGERGVKISGGQRQRIGIARALYHQPDVLVFDEATSALDGMTEDSVTEAIRALRGNQLIILIAHRLRTVQACDRIVLLEEGRVIADGPYAELLQSSQAFRDLVHGSDQASTGVPEAVLAANAHAS